jgi:hypothetical protein
MVKKLLKIKFILKIIRYFNITIFDKIIKENDFEEKYGFTINENEEFKNTHTFDKITYEMFKRKGVNLIRSKELLNFKNKFNCNDEDDAYYEKTISYGKKGCSGNKSPLMVNPYAIQEHNEFFKDKQKYTFKQLKMVENFKTNTILNNIKYNLNK